MGASSVSPEAGNMSCQRFESVEALVGAAVIRGAVGDRMAGWVRST